MKPSRCIILFESYVWNLSRMRGFPLPKKKKTTRDKWNESVGCNVNGNRNEIIDESMEVYNEIKKTYELGAKKQEIRTKKKEKENKTLRRRKYRRLLFSQFCFVWFIHRHRKVAIDQEVRSAKQFLFYSKKISWRSENFR